MILAWPVLAAVLIFVIWQFLRWLGRIDKRIEKVEFEQNYEKDKEKLKKLSADFNYKFREMFEKYGQMPIYDTTIISN